MNGVLRHWILRKTFHDFRNTLIPFQWQGAILLLLTINLCASASDFILVMTNIRLIYKLTHNELYDWEWLLFWLEDEHFSIEIHHQVYIRNPNKSKFHYTIMKSILKKMVQMLLIIQNKTKIPWKELQFQNDEIQLIVYKVNLLYRV